MFAVPQFGNHPESFSEIRKTILLTLVPRKASPVTVWTRLCGRAGIHSEDKAVFCGLTPSPVRSLTSSIRALEIATRWV